MKIKTFENFISESLTKGIGYSDMEESDREYIIQKQKRDIENNKKLDKFIKIIDYIKDNPNSISNKFKLEFITFLSDNSYKLSDKLKEILHQS